MIITDNFYRALFSNTSSTLLTAPYTQPMTKKALTYTLNQFQSQFQSLLCDIQTCIESLVGRMYSYKLKVNAEKTEVLPVASSSRLSSVGRDSETEVASAYHSNLQLGT